MLFLVKHPGSLGKDEAVYPVVTDIVPVRGVNAAARHDSNVCALAHIEVVIDQIVYAALGNTGGDINGLALGAGLYADNQPGAVLLVFQLDVLGGLSACALAV